MGLEGRLADEAPASLFPFFRGEMSGVASFLLPPVLLVETVGDGAWLAAALTVGVGVERAVGQGHDAFLRFRA